MLEEQQQHNNNNNKKTQMTFFLVQVWLYGNTQSRERPHPARRGHDTPFRHTQKHTQSLCVHMCMFMWEWMDAEIHIQHKQYAFLHMLTVQKALMK